MILFLYCVAHVPPHVLNEHRNHHCNVLNTYCNLTSKVFYELPLSNICRIVLSNRNASRVFIAMSPHMKIGKSTIVNTEWSGFETSIVSSETDGSVVSWRRSFKGGNTSRAQIAKTA